VWNNQAQNVALLLESGADPAIRNAAGLTALELAQNRGYKELVGILEGFSKVGL
jgi:ankyrin repeat protein